MHELWQELFSPLLCYSFSFKILNILHLLRILYTKIFCYSFGAFILSEEVEHWWKKNSPEYGSRGCRSGSLWTEAREYVRSWQCSQIWEIVYVLSHYNGVYAIHWPPGDANVFLSLWINAKFMMKIAWQELLTIRMWVFFGTRSSD